MVFTAQVDIQAWAQRAWAQRAYPPVLKGDIAANSLQDFTSSRSSYSPATGGACNIKGKINTL